MVGIAVCVSLTCTAEGARAIGAELTPTWAPTSDSVVFEVGRHYQGDIYTASLAGTETQAQTFRTRPPPSGAAEFVREDDGGDRREGDVPLRVA